MHVSLSCERYADPGILSTLIQRWNLTSYENASMTLVLTEKRLELRKRGEPKLGALYVDFVSGALKHRYCFRGNHRTEALARAVGLKYGKPRNVLDATAGLGRDAFMLAALGCRVSMLERHPVVGALLDDGLFRGHQDAKIGSWLRERLTLLYEINLIDSSVVDLLPRPDVVYLDPMYPIKKKRALVKKDMRILRFLVGGDDDADNLLAPARKLATKRIVVKRPDYARPMCGVSAHGSILTKSHRFDIYMPI